MDPIMLERLPAVQLFSVGPQQVERVAPLLTADAAELLRAGRAFGLVIAEEGEVRGAACARLSPENDICLELVSLYVAAQYRRRCLGSTLLLALLEACGDAFEGTIARVEAAFSREQGLESFLAKAGFHLEQEEDAFSYIAPVSALADSPLMQDHTAQPADRRLMRLEDLSPLHVRQLLQALKKAGVDYMDLHQLSNALSGVSFALLDAKMQPVACAVFTGQEDCLCLSQFFTARGHTAGGMAVLQAAAGALLEQYPDAQLEIPVLTRSSAKLAERLLGNAGDRRPLVRAVLEL